MKYKTASKWYDAAMKRANGVTAEESERRREMAVQHRLKEGVEIDADTLADYELYILGKMDIDEYQQYLLLKHGS